MNEPIKEHHLLKNFFSKIKALYLKLKGKIAFYPSLLAIAGVFFAILMMYLENRGISDYLVENISILVVDNGDTALTILSACITGLISMMVFSFSMVMLLLNQASSNYSPRLLPGLISDRRHQIILGIYLFSILYCIFILFSIQPTGDKYQIPGFSVLLGILATVISLYAFIYFIHNISNSIQITHILKRIFTSAKVEIEKDLENDEEIENTFPDSSQWHEYTSEKSGYYQDFSRESLLDFCKEKDTRLDILPVKGSFIIKGIPILRAEKKLSEKEFKVIMRQFRFSREELIYDNYVLAFKQITEVIVKAMSPGINDPGTALNAIDYLTELLQLRMKKSDDSFILEDNRIWIDIRTVDFKELVFNIIAAIRTYCKHDIVVIQKMGVMFYYLKSQKTKESYYHEVLRTEAKRLLSDAHNSMDNTSDQDLILGIAKKLELNLN